MITRRMYLRCVYRRCVYRRTPQGSLWKVVRASMTLVGLLPPVLDESGDLLVGG